MVTNGEGGAMAEDDRCFADLESRYHCFLGNMRQVHQHAYSIHLFNHYLCANEIVEF